MLECKVGQLNESLEKPPDHVSFSLNRCTHQSNGTLRVINIQERRKEYKYVVCIHGALHQNYSHWYRLVEHVEVHTLFGADYYAIYNNTGSSVLRPNLDYYRDTGRMEVHEWHIPPGTAHNNGQLSLINDCLYRFMYRTQYLALVDLDEFIVPKGKVSWDSMLKTGPCKDHLSFLFRNVFFNAEDSASLNNSLSHFGKSLTLTRTTRPDYIFPCGTRSKFIARPESILTGTVHYPESPPGVSCCMKTRNGLLHHYRDSLPSGKLGESVHDTTMYEFAKDILASVNRTIKGVRLGGYTNSSD